MSKWYKTIIILASIGTLALAALPIVGVRYEGDAVSGMLLIRGYNLMEFSPWGVIPLMTSSLIPAILFGKQSQMVKEAELLILLIANMLCYVHCVHLAVEFLRTSGISLLTYHPNLFLYPISFVCVLMLAKILEFKSENKEVENVTRNQIRRFVRS